MCPIDSGQEPSTNCLQFLAKAFLERDYEAIQATKVENQPAQEPVDQTGVKSEPEPQPEPEPEPAVPPPEETKVEVPIKSEPQPATEDTTTTNPPPAAEPSQPNEPEQPVKTEKPDEAPTIPEQQPPAPSEETKLEPGLDDGGGGGVNEFDLHLDFGDDEMGNQNFLSGSNIGAGVGGGDPSSSVPTGGDAFDMEFEKAEQPQQHQQQQPGADGQGGDNTEDIMAPGESSFDDLFMGSENFGGEGGDQGLLEGDGLMNLNELDDNWFT